MTFICSITVLQHISKEIFVIYFLNYRSQDALCIYIFHLYFNQFLFLKFKTQFG